MVEACIHLHEWELAEEFNKLDTQHGDSSQPQEWCDNRIRQARIEGEIGSIEEACDLLRDALSSAHGSTWATLQSELADFEHRRGRTRRALDLLDEWHAYQPLTLDQLRGWLSSWNQVLVTSARILSRTHREIARRCVKAIDKAGPVDSSSEQVRVLYREYESLSLLDRWNRGADDWGRLLEVARELCAHQARASIKGADGGWVIAVVSALNGLDRPQDALHLAEVAMAQLDERSWHRHSAAMEIARAHMLLGDFNLACQIAEDIRARTSTARRMLAATEAAELLFEILPHAPDSILEARARGTLEQAKLQALDPKDAPDIGPLPGEVGWETRASQLLLRCVGGFDNEAVQAVQNDAADAALGQAAELGLTAAIPVLLDRGAQVDSGTLARAVRAGHIRVLDQLLRARNGVDLSNVGDGHIVSGVVRSGRANVLRLLLKHAINITPERLTEVCIAVAHNGDDELLDVLLEAGVDPENVDSSGQLPLVAAAGEGSLAIVERLARKTPLTATSRGGTTALMAAARGGHIPVIELLADLRVDVGVKDKSGENALDIAAATGNFVALARLSDRFGIPLDRERHINRAISTAIRQGNESEIRQALIIGHQPGRYSLDAKITARLRSALKKISTTKKVTDKGSLSAPGAMNIGLVVNARGKMCLVHDKPFEATPLWVGYHVDKKQIEIIFDTGATFPIDWEATDEMNEYLLKINKIFDYKNEK